MLRLCAYDEPIEDKVLAKTLLKGSVAGLTMGWKQDLGEKEDLPQWLLRKRIHNCWFVPLAEVPPGVHEVLWEKDGLMEQLVFTDKAIFWSTQVYPIGSGLTKVTPADLKQLQIYLTGSGMRIIAFGDEVDPNLRKYQPYRSSEKIPELLRGMVLLGQVDLNTGEIWPIPKEAR